MASELKLRRSSVQVSVYAFVSCLHYFLLCTFFDSMHGCCISTCKMGLNVRKVLTSIIHCWAHFLRVSAFGTSGYQTEVTMKAQNISQTLPPAFETSVGSAKLKLLLNSMKAFRTIRFTLLPVSI